MGILIKLKNGEYPLWKTFWIFGVVIRIIFSFILGVFNIGELQSFLIIPSLLFVLYSYFLVIGLWKSADKYEGKKIWIILSKFYAIIWIIQALFIFIVVFSKMS